VDWLTWTNCSRPKTKPSEEENEMNFGLGEWLSLSCALFWAWATISFRIAGDKLSPFHLNLFKNLSLFILMIPTAWMAEGWSWDAIGQADQFYLLLSGFIGICIADFLYFAALNRLGAGLNSILACLYSPLVILFSFLLLGERLNSAQAIGALVIIIGTFLASATGMKHERPQELGKGIALGVASMITMALGIVIAIPRLHADTLFWAIELRLLGGIGLAVLVLLVPGKGRAFVQAFKQRNLPWKTLLSGTLVAAFVALIVWMKGFQLMAEKEAASIAAILNQTSTFFTIGLAAIFLRERLTPAKLTGAAIAFGGVWWIATH
jgi:drug/metabolite transporter (DMT)-like permease